MGEMLERRGGKAQKGVKILMLRKIEEDGNGIMKSDDEDDDGILIQKKMLTKLKVLLVVLEAVYC